MAKTEFRSLVSILAFVCLAILVSSCEEQLPVIGKAADFDTDCS